MFSCGAGGTRTRVRIRNPNVFYMLISLLFFVNGLAKSSPDCRQAGEPILIFFISRGHRSANHASLTFTMPLCQARLNIAL